TKLTASDAQAEDEFGASVAVSGDIILVGAFQEDSAGDEAGAAYLFLRDQGGADNWGEVTKLKASDAEAGDFFGVSVAVSGKTAIIGADAEDAGGDFAGAAYVFQRGQGGPDNWGEVTKLTASDAQATDWFGATVAVSGDTAVVGAYLEDAGGDFAGAAYVFQRDHGGANAWGEVTKLTASDAQAEDEFGASVAVSGDIILVGAFQEDAAGDEAGAAYVFLRDRGGADNWGEVTKLKASDAEAGDFFGVSVAVSGNTAIIGADAEDAGGSIAGAAYVLQRDRGGADNWGEVTKLTASDAQAGDFFGSGVSISGDTAIVGAFREELDAGAAYVFGRDQDGTDSWGEVTKLTASDAQGGDFFGIRVAISNGATIVGAFHEDAGGIGAGAAYLFESGAGPIGDANCDGLVSSIDAALVLQFVAGLLSALACEDAADADGDGNLSSIDAALILQYSAGLLSSLPPSP
ncbi:MAG: hypothetical protein IIB21_05900, partial [Chloroflexi bacterium]|nr:hypothetical protein [Chloroflexota bacterium]